jgi:hypothetical protein
VKSRPRKSRLRLGVQRAPGDETRADANGAV